jgi:hypothetical protein
MEGFGAVFANRDFECILCQRHFTRASADLILTDDMICDDCLGELQGMNENDLREHVSQQLGKNPARCSQELEDEIVRIIQQMRPRGKGRGPNLL